MSDRETNEKNNIEETLQDKETKLRIKKLEIECEVVKYQLSKRFNQLEILKSLSGIGSVLAAFFALATIFFSILKWSDDNKQARLIQSNEKFENALSALKDPLVRKRMDAIIYLKSFLQEDLIKSAQLLLSLNNALLFEEDENVSNSILQLLSEMNVSKIDSNALREGLISLISINRNYFRKPKHDRNNKIEKSILTAMQSYLKKGVFVKDMSNISFDSLDLSEVTFMNGVSFENSDLSNANFAGITCESCNFKNSILYRTNFSKAVLRGSDFGYTTKTSSVVLNKWIKDSIFECARFDSAILINAEFENFPICITAGRFGPEILIIPPSFYYANLDRADFRKSVIWKVYSTSENIFYTYPQEVSNVSDYTLEEYRIPSIFRDADYRYALVPTNLLKYF